MFVDGDDLTGALHVLQLQLSPLTTFIILNCSKIQNGDVLVPAYLSFPEKWPLNECFCCFSVTRWHFCFPRRFFTYCLLLYSMCVCVCDYAVNSTDGVLYEQAVWVADFYIDSRRAGPAACSAAQVTHPLNSAHLSAAWYVCQQPSCYDADFNILLSSCWGPWENLWLEHDICELHTDANYACPHRSVCIPIGHHSFPSIPAVLTWFCCSSFCCFQFLYNQPVYMVISPG